MRRLLTLLALVAALAVPVAASAAPTVELEFLGQQIIPTGTQFQGTNFGGLSSIAYDERRNLFYAFSDDQVNVRYYTLRIGVATGVPAVQILGVTTLRDASVTRTSAERDLVRASAAGSSSVWCATRRASPTENGPMRSGSGSAVGLLGNSSPNVCRFIDRSR